MKASERIQRILDTVDKIRDTEKRIERTTSLLISMGLHRSDFEGEQEAWEQNLIDIANLKTELSLPQMMSNERHNIEIMLEGLEGRYDLQLKYLGSLVYHGLANTTIFVGER